MRTFSSVGTREQLVAPQVERRRRDAVDVGRASRAPYHSSGSPNAGVVARLGAASRRRRRRRASRPTRSPGGGRRRRARRRPRRSATVERLDLAVEHLDVGLARAHDVRLDLLAGPGRGPRRARAIVEQIDRSAHAAVPPTVSSRDAQRRLARRHRHALAVLAAHAGPGVEVVADRVDPPQHLGTVADQLRGADRVGDLAVLDQVRLGDRRTRSRRSRCSTWPPPSCDAVDAVLGVRRMMSSGSSSPSSRNVFVIRTIGRCW